MIERPSIKQKPMFDYTKFMNNCAEKRSNVDIANRSIEHAKILTSKLVEIADHRVCLLSGACEDKFYSQEAILKNFLSFIERTKGEGKIEIIFEKERSKSWSLPV